jgi:hypothetical protein
MIAPTARADARGVRVRPARRHALRSLVSLLALVAAGPLPAHADVPATPVMTL